MPETPAALRALAAIYAKVPKLVCRGLCSESCGPIAASQLEVARLEHASGKKLSVDSELTCSALSGGRCSAYEARPLICRLFGTVRGMRCPHGCAPEHWLSDGKAKRLLKQSVAVGGPLVSVDVPEGR